MKLPQLESNEHIREIALTALIEVASNPNNPAAARAAASRTLMEAIGAIGRLQDLSRMAETRNAAEMTPAELQDEIARLSHRVPPPRMRKVKTT